MKVCQCGLEIKVLFVIYHTSDGKTTKSGECVCFK